MDGLVITEHSYFSIMHGCNVSRVGTWGHDGQERYVMLNLDLPAKVRRSRREIALIQLEESLANNQPGEVIVDYEVDYG